MASPQLDFGDDMALRPCDGRLADPATGAPSCPETYSIGPRGNTITRHVELRSGQTAASSLPLERLSRKGRLSQAALSAIWDVSLLRSTEWPAVRPDAATIRTADLFSGCGIMSLGVWEAARAVGLRMEAAVALDLNLTAIGVYKRNFPEATALTSAVERHLDGELGKRPTAMEKKFVRSLGYIDLLIGGPPCQGHSNLNNHTRRDDPKNRLYARMARFAELLRPRSVIIENVPAVLHDRERVVEHTIASLTKLGYVIDHGVVDSSALGVPQRRRRHVLMASLDHMPNLARTIASHSRGTRSVGWAIEDLVSHERTGVFDTPSVPSQENQKRMEWLLRNEKHDLPNRLRPRCHKEKDHSYKSVYGRMYWDKPAQTITSGFTSMGQGRFVHPRAARTITPHEAARLQFIPDFFSFGDQTGRTALSEMIGNAVPARLSYVIALDLLR